MRTQNRPKKKEAKHSPGGNMQTLKRPKKRSQEDCTHWELNLGPLVLPTKVPQELAVPHHRRVDAIAKKGGGGGASLWHPPVLHCGCSAWFI